MWDFLNRLFDSSEFVPPQQAGGWSTELVWLHAGSDVLIWMAYLAIPAVMLYFVRRRRDLPFSWIFWMFGLFIVSSGFTHLLAVVTLSVPVYRLAALVKLVTAVVSVATVVALIPLVPRLLALRGPKEFEREIAERKKVEEKFRVLLESAPDAMLIVRKDGEIVLVNSETERLFGYKREELLGRSADVLVPNRFRGDRLSQRSGYYVRPGARRAAPEQQLYGLRKDGSEFPVEIRLAPLETEEGTFISSSIRDVTERKRAESALRETEERFRLLVEGTHDYSILLLDPQGRIASWNIGAERITGYRVEEILGRHFSIFFPRLDMEAGHPTRELAVAAAEGKFEEEGWRVRKDGSRYWASVAVTALRDAAGNLRGFSKVTRDISERRQAEEKLRLYASRLQESNRELQDFASVASHDLQEPLRKIQAFGDRLRSKSGGHLDEQGRDYLDRMQSAAGRMRTLIDDLLTYSRVASKAQPFVPVDLAKVAREVVSDLEVRIHQTEGRVEIGELPTIDADAMQMRQLFQNLIGNGLKFHRQEEKPVIRVHAELVPVTHSNGHASSVPGVRLSVEDNGIGFDEKYLDRLFHVFSRLHGRSEYEGTGMGLAICKRIAERHGGTISALGRPGKGATFIVSLPLHQRRHDEGVEVSSGRRTAIRREGETPAEPRR